MKHSCHLPFFFQKVSPLGFGMMRSAWACTVLLFFLFQWNDVTAYYSADGILPLDLRYTVLRQSNYFSLLTYIQDPQLVFALYLFFLANLVCMMLGVYPRISTSISVLLLFSFHEANPLPLGGGDTLLRNIGFILLICPTVSSFSLKRVKAHFARFKTSHTLLPEQSMPIWPYRLLLWQLLILYGTSFWYKLLGTMWIQGAGAAVAFHHPWIFRWSEGVAVLLNPVSIVISYVVLLYTGSWLLLLVPKSLSQKYLPQSLAHISLKRCLLLIGLFFHGGILFLVDAGSFTFAELTAYIGLLLAEDINTIKLFFKHRWKKRLKQRRTKKTQHSFPSSHIAVLYDGTCGLCVRSIFYISILDAFKRLQTIDFHTTKERKKVAPDLSLKDLDKAMHIRFPDGHTLSGFDAFRALSWHLPGLFPLLPFLYIPGIPLIGRRVYAHIAARRKACSHKSCGVY